MKKLFNLLSMLTVAVHLSAGSVSDLQGVVLKNVKIPIYSKNVLQVMAFADHAERSERLLVSSATFLDVLLKNVNVDLIRDGWKQKLYSLDAPLQEVVSFWKNRHMTSDAVLYTDKSNIDQSSSKASGSDPVFMRSPMLDLNGLGFRCDFQAGAIEILADVHITARTAASDPRDILTGRIKMPPEYNVIRAKSDSMRIDRKHNEIMLIGNVEVIDGGDILTCDRLTIFLSDEKTTAKSSRDDTIKGVSRVLADGEVVLIRKPVGKNGPEEEQRATCEHLEYEIADGKITMTGEESNPSLSQGSENTLTGTRIELLRHSQKAFVRGFCRIDSRSIDEDGKTIVRKLFSDNADFDGVNNLNVFTGNVKAIDPDMVITCDRMRVFMKNSAAAEKEKSATGFSPVSGKKEIEKILCNGKLRIESIPENKSTEKPTVLTSKYGELDYNGNKLVFFENVYVTDQESNLRCERLDLFLADKNSTARNKSSNVVPLAGKTNGGSKTLTKVTAAGRTFMKNTDSDLATDFMTLYFRDLPPGVKPSPGMFQSGGVQLIKITCDGSVVAHSYSEADKSGNKTLFPSAGGRKTNTLKCKHAISDLLTDLSEFHENVSVNDGANLLTCRNMYVFTGKAPQNARVNEVKKAEEDPDADPFALDMSEDSAPSRIALSDGMDLKRIVCKNDVLLTRKDSRGKPQYAGGDNAVYTVENRDIIITSNPPSRPYMRSDGRIQYCDIIRGNLASEEIRGIGNVQVVPDK